MTKDFTGGFDMTKEAKEKIYAPGTKIKLIHMDDPHPVPDGTIGTVVSVDDMGQIHMKWENGSSLAINEEYGDKFEIIQEK